MMLRNQCRVHFRAAVGQAIDFVFVRNANKAFLPRFGRIDVGVKNRFPLIL